MKSSDEKNRLSISLSARVLQFSIFIIIVSLFSLKVSAQQCPPNIDFEGGNFNGWTCYTGTTAAVGGQNVMALTPSGPSFGRHTLYGSNSAELDPYGHFPVKSPNGSGYSIRLGNNYGGGEAEGIAYEFTIPANQNSYSLIYNYAVVFQAPNHRPEEQPRMEIEITNVTDGNVINCASFTFISVGSSLPGFEVSDNYDDTTQVLFKNWSAVSVDLSGNAGKKIRLFFKTADCTFRKHFGYAYIDVNSGCSGSFVGATYCPDDTAVNVTAPYGYSNYTWFDSSLTTVIGNQQTIRFSPPPRTGTTIAVKLDPYSGYGCQQTLYAHLVDTLTVQANAGPDLLACNKNPVQIGEATRPGLQYSWSPNTYLSSATIANPLANPDATTSYILSARSSGGGCLSQDTVVVKTSMIDNTLSILGKAAYCFGYGDSAVLQVPPTDNIQWYRNGAPINGARFPTYKVQTTGNYTAKMVNKDGCTISTIEQPILIERPLPGVRYKDKFALNNIPLPLQARQLGESALWNPARYLNIASSFTPVFKGVSEQLYTIQLKTFAGCISIDTQLVKTIKAVEILVPTAFTPNSDGRNDLLRPIVRGIKQIKYFRIYNRLGQLLFQTEEMDTGWNGTIKGLPQQTQTVVWTFEGIGLDDKVYNEKGTTVLLK